MELWTEVAHLKGCTLHTLDQGHPFDIVDLTPSKIVLLLHTTGKNRHVRRTELEAAWHELRQRGQLTRTTIRDRYSEANPAYIAAILAALPGVTHTLSPITLTLRRPT